jgi:hypothetical protein
MPFYCAWYRTSSWCAFIGLASKTLWWDQRKRRRWYETKETGGTSKRGYVMTDRALTPLLFSSQSAVLTSYAAYFILRRLLSQRSAWQRSMYDLKRSRRIHVQGSSLATRRISVCFVPDVSETVSSVMRWISWENLLWYKHNVADATHTWQQLLTRETKTASETLETTFTLTRSIVWKDFTFNRSNLRTIVACLMPFPKQYALKAW